jgi:hypothetical protein
MQPPPQASMPPVVAAPAPAPSELKLRLGANLGIMMFSPGPSYGLNFSARAGVRLGSLLAAYLDAGKGFGLGGGGSVSQSGASLSVNVVGYWRVGVVGELTLGPLFLSLGPALFNGSWVGVSESGGTSGASQEVYAAGGYFPSAIGRLGFAFGDTNKFTLAVEGMAVLGKVTEVSQSGGTSGASQSVKTGNRALAYSPALMLGWDMN